MHSAAIMPGACCNAFSSSGRASFHKQPAVGSGRVTAAASRAKATIPTGQIAPTTTGADLGVAWALSEKASLALEIGARYHGDVSDDDSAIGGLGLATINDTGSRTAFPVGVRFQMRF